MVMEIRCTWVKWVFVGKDESGDRENEFEEPTIDFWWLRPNAPVDADMADLIGAI